MVKKTARDVDVAGKRVLVRVDFNVPLDINTGAITDDSRIKSALPTLRYLIDHKATVILCSHLGRPDGKVIEGLRMSVVAKRLSKLIGLPVLTAPNSIGPEVEKIAAKLNSDDILLLENIRFHAEEEKNDPGFAQSLAKLADIYVDDAFGTAHRAHASTVGITKYLPAVAGFLMEKELTSLGHLVSNPEHLFCALLGGAKVSDKIGLIKNILGKVDLLLIGGGMAATFLKVQGYEVGLSLLETDKQSSARDLIEAAADCKTEIFLPVDVVVSSAISEQAKGKVVSIGDIPADNRIVDIGPETIEQFTLQLKKSRTVFWNGPMGIYEIPQFAAGTKRLAEVMANLKATTIVGGGSTAEVVEELGLVGKMTHVSTGGGASLQFLEGKSLPAVDALLDK